MMDDGLDLTDWGKALACGLALTLAVFLVVPMTQLLTDREREVETVREVDAVDPPPPPPEPPRKNETRETETKRNPRPQLKRAPRQKPQRPQLEQIDLALNPRAGSVLRGDYQFGFPEVSAGIDAFELSEVDQNPHPIAKVDPVYPARLKSDDIGGSVVLEIVVDANGEVSDATVVRSTHQAFSRSCLRAIRRWKFKPGKRDGRAVATRLIVPFRFEK